MSYLSERLKSRAVWETATGTSEAPDNICWIAAEALDAAEKALQDIANINLGPDKASGEWRCTEAEAIARAALARLEDSK